ncbi:MAG: hypothetical protein J6U20_03815 [Fibrobacter sp.]|nr:hypothetical protein [Fibrobacter sp.]
MANISESSKWRKFLQPVVAGLALFLAAASTAMNKTDSDNAEARFTALEIKTEALEEERKADKADLSMIREAVYVIRTDVAFMRGKMEAGGK